MGGPDSEREQRKRGRSTGLWLGLAAALLVGAVFVTRNDGGEDPPNITAFSTICPHLGCSVKFIDDKSKPHFNCPCHKSKFKLTGEAINDTPPRPLDTLEIDAEKLKNDAEVWVKYERFKTNTAEKKPA